MYAVKNYSSAKDISLSDSGDIRSLQDFIVLLETQFDDPVHYVNITNNNLNDLSKWFENLKNMDKGGFSHGEVGSKYGVQQLDLKKITSRSIGYKGIFFLLQREKSWEEHEVLLDVLAGNGTMGRMLEQLYAKHPKYIGNDVSLNLVIQGVLDQKLIYYSDIRSNFLKQNIAEYAACSYGSHHIPIQNREEFIWGCYQKIKKGGTFALQDFESRSATAQWYSVCIDTYRHCGHQYEHFTPQSMKSLLHTAGFKNISVHHIYDPFILKISSDISDEQAKKDFYKYLINLYALDRIGTKITNGDIEYSDLGEIFDKYFNVEPEMLERCVSLSSLGYDEHLIASMLTIKPVRGARHLIAPRIALTAVGEK